MIPYVPSARSESASQASGSSPATPYASAAPWAGGYLVVAGADLALLVYVGCLAAAALTAAQGRAWDEAFLGFVYEMPRLGIGASGIGCLSNLLFAMWIYRLVANIPSQAAGADAPSPIVAAVTSVVPVVNLVWPYRSIRRALRSTREGPPDSLLASLCSPPAMAITGAQGLFIVEMALRGLAMAQWSPKNLTTLVLVGVVVQLGRVAATVGMVRMVTHRQDARAAQLAGQPASFPAERPGP